MDGNGCCPDAASSTARNKKNAASVGTRCWTTKLLTNCETSDWKFASQVVEIPPDGRGTATPNEVNQLSSGCKVRKTTAQNIHFVNPPPIAKVSVPSRRRLTLASTSESIAADGASSKRTEITSFSSCGVPIFVNLVSLARSVGRGVSCAAVRKLSPRPTISWTVSVRHR